MDHYKVQNLTNLKRQDMPHILRTDSLKSSQVLLTVRAIMVPNKYSLIELYLSFNEGRQKLIQNKGKNKKKRTKAKKTVRLRKHKHCNPGYVAGPI